MNRFGGTVRDPYRPLGRQWGGPAHCLKAVTTAQAITRSKGGLHATGRDLSPLRVLRYGPT